MLRDASERKKEEGKGRDRRGRKDGVGGRQSAKSTVHGTDKRTWRED